MVMRTGDTNDHDHTCAELTDARSALSHLGQTELGAHLHYSILPLLQQQPTANLSKHDVLNLLSTLLKLDKHLLRFELSCSSEYSCFFSSLVALSVNCIISNAAAIPKSQLNLSSEACSVLLQYLLHCIQLPSPVGPLSNLQIFGLIQSLCEDKPALGKCEVVQLCAVLKSCKFPSELSPPNEPTSGTGYNKPSSLVVSERESNEPKRIKLDKVDTLIDHLIVPITQKPLFYTDPLTDCELSISEKANLLSKNLYALQKFDGTSILLDFVANLSSLQPFVAQLKECEENGTDVRWPKDVNECADLIASIKQLSLDIDLVYSVLSMPILEPFDSERLTKVVSLLHTSLYVSLALIAAHARLLSTGHVYRGSIVRDTSKLDHKEEFDLSLLNDLNVAHIEIYLRVVAQLKRSLRVFGHCCQNVHLFSCWLLFSFVQHILSQNTLPLNTWPEKKKQCESQTAYNYQCISLVNHMFYIFEQLLADLRCESASAQFTKSSASLASDPDSTPSDITTTTDISVRSPFDKFGTYSAVWRVQFLLSSFKLPSICFQLGWISYQKTVKFFNWFAKPESGSTSVPSNATRINSSNFGQHHSFDWQLDSSRDNITDDDSEPMLSGLFAEESDRGEDLSAARMQLQTIRLLAKSPKNVAISRRWTPTNHIQIGTQIFHLLTNFFVYRDMPQIMHHCRSNLTLNELQLLADLVQDLDRHLKIPEAAKLSELEDFVSAVRSFIHDLIAVETLTDEQQIQLLQLLHIHPDATMQYWPLHIPVISLSVLAQVLLIRIKRDRKELRGNQIGGWTVLIWKALLNHLQSRIENPNVSDSLHTQTDFDDLNVEHAQLLLFAFHSVDLLQRKAIFHHLCQVLIQVHHCVNNPMSTVTIFYVSRLLHLFEYFLVNLYEGPPQLAEQVSFYLFRIFQSPKDHVTSDAEADNHSDQSSSSNHDFAGYYADINRENFLQFCLPNISRPKFYLLHRPTKANDVQSLKLDGLTLQFMLSLPQGYDRLYDALQQYLLVIDQLHDMIGIPIPLERKFSFVAIKYCFNVAWRIMNQMPPSAKLMKAYDSKDLERSSSGHEQGNQLFLVMLQAAIWHHRLSLPKFRTVVLDYLGKQMHQPIDANPTAFLDEFVEQTSPIKLAPILLKEYARQFGSRDTTRVASPLEVFSIELLLSQIMMLMNQTKASTAVANAETERLKQALIPTIPALLTILDLYIGYANRTILSHAIAEDRTLNDPQQKCTNNHLISVYLYCRDSHMVDLKICFSSVLYKQLMIWNLVEFDQNTKFQQSRFWLQSHLESHMPFESLLISAWDQSFGDIHNRQMSEDFQHLHNQNLRRFLAITLCSLDEITQFVDISPSLMNRVARTVTPLLCNLALQSYGAFLNRFKEKLWLIDSESDRNHRFNVHLYIHLLGHVYPLLRNHAIHLHESIQVEFIKLLEQLLTSSAGQTALLHFFRLDCEEDYDIEPIRLECKHDVEPDTNVDLVSLIHASAEPHLPSSFAARMLNLLVKLLDKSEQNNDCIALILLCSSLRRLSQDADKLHNFLRHVFTLSEPKDLELDQKTNHANLLRLCQHLVRNNSVVDEAVPSALLHALFPFGDQMLNGKFDTISFAEYLQMLIALSSGPNGPGHVPLVQISLNWLAVCQQFLNQNEVRRKIEQQVASGRHLQIIDAYCHLLAYLRQLFDAIHLNLSAATSDNETTTNTSFPTSKTILGVSCGTSGATIAAAFHGLSDYDRFGDSETDLADFANDDEDSANEDEEADTEEQLQSRLCTFTVTQRDFMNQHWYHCHTCKMVDNVGVCTVCAKVCHRGHDVTYAKYGSFFCDCGARGQDQCSALIKRTAEERAGSYQLPGYAAGKSLFGLSDSISSSPFDRYATGSLVARDSPTNHSKLVELARSILPAQQELIQLTTQRQVCPNIVQLLDYLSTTVQNISTQSSSIQSSTKCEQALQQLHSSCADRIVQRTEKLISPTLGSQESAFESGKLTFTGDQGQIIKQLIANFAIKRVSMCILSQIGGRRQHLAVCHENGKISIFQLSSLLKQADAAKKKLTLSRLTSVSVPFTVVSITANPNNEEVLAVCGLKDAHVLSLNAAGGVSGHIDFRACVDPNDYIIKSIWLPASETEVAMVTSQYVIIFDLAVSIDTPKYHFMLPFIKIKDACFACDPLDGSRHLLIMAENGRLYNQPMSSDALNGIFYITNMLPLTSASSSATAASDSDTEDTVSAVNGGGISIYYSHVLQLLFVSFANGTTLYANFKKIGTEIARTNVLRAVTDETADAASDTKRNLPQECHPFWQWNEIPGHPGLLHAFTVTTNQLYVFMFKPDSIFYQPLKSNCKSKLIDVVSIRHHVLNGSHRSTLIALHEDLSMRIFTAVIESTDYWIRPELCNGSGSALLQQARSSLLCCLSNKFAGRPKRKQLSRHSVQTTPGGSLSFPIDFFESTIMLNDIEFGGRELLQVYNVAQLKLRLNCVGMYIVCNRADGFSLEITNRDQMMAVVGVRVMIGTHDVNKAPSSIEVFGRTINVSLTQSRWFDIPFTREESHLADKKFHIHFGVSSDPNKITIIDSVKVYGKLKDNLWQEDDCESYNESISGNVYGVDSHLTCDFDVLSLAEVFDCVIDPLHLLFMQSFNFIAAHLSVLQHSAATTDAVNYNEVKKSLLDICRPFISLPLPVPLHQCIKTLLITVLGSKSAHIEFRDTIVLRSLFERLVDPPTSSGETLFRLMIWLKSILITRSSLQKELRDLINETNLPKQHPAFFGGEINDENIPGNLLRFISDYFWQVYATRSIIEGLPTINAKGLVHTGCTVQAFVDIIFAFALTDDRLVAMSLEIFLKLVLCDNLHINYVAAQTLIRNLKVCIAKVTKPTAVDVEAASSKLETAELGSTTTRSGEFVQSFDKILASTSAFDNLLDERATTLEQEQAMINLCIGLGASLQAQNLLQPPSAELESSTGVEANTSTAVSDEETTSSTLDMQQSANATTAAQVKVGEDFSPTICPENAMSRQCSRVSLMMRSILRNLLPKLDCVQRLNGVRCIPLMKLILLLGSNLDPQNEDDRTLLMDLLRRLLMQLDIDSKGDFASQVDMHERNDRNEVKLILLRLLSILWSRIKWSVESAADISKLLTEFGLLDFCLQTLKQLQPYWRTQHTDALSNASVTMPASTIATSGNVSSPPGANILDFVTRNRLLQKRTTNQPLDMSPLFLKQYVRGHIQDVFQSYQQLVSELLLRLPYQLKKQFAHFESINKGQTSISFQNMFSGDWQLLLCDYIMLELTASVHKQVRKLLTYLCGSKDRYRFVRDLHMIKVHLNHVQLLCVDLISAGNEFETSDNRTGIKTRFDLPYDKASQLMEKLNATLEIALSRSMHWQHVCLRQDNTLPFLMRIAVKSNAYIAMVIIQLLQASVNPRKSSSTNTNRSDKPIPTTPIPIPATSVATTNTSTVGSSTISKPVLFDIDAPPVIENLSRKIAEQFLSKIPSQQLSDFVHTFLFDCSQTTLRWQTHQFLQSLFTCIQDIELRTRLLKILWDLWPLVSNCGKRAIEFVDLIGFYTREWKVDQSLQTDFVSRCVRTLYEQNEHMRSHPNSLIYNELQAYIELEGYYLDGQPCGVCGSGEQSMKAYKLSALKVESRFTTTCQLIKLIGPHCIQRVTVHIADVKRTKMVKRACLYYSNRPVNSLVVLRDRRTAQWYRIKELPVAPGQTEIRFDLPLPVVACNLMIEYSAFYEHIQSGTETLQCPRCSAVVAANPGVCGNCGENVFQCHKCRAINYDEKDPYLCNSCGFCKYAKFDFTLIAKPSITMERIENEADRRQAVLNIQGLLEMSDRAFRVLIAQRPLLESILARIQKQQFLEKSPDQLIESNSAMQPNSAPPVNAAPLSGVSLQGNNVPANNAINAAPVSAAGAGTSTVANSTGGGNQISGTNTLIQKLSQKYSFECRNKFVELSRLQQRILAARQEMIGYDCRLRAQMLPFRPSDTGSESGCSINDDFPPNEATYQSTSIVTKANRSSSRCYGCVVATLHHCVTLLNAFTSHPDLRPLLAQEQLFNQLLEFNLINGPVELRSNVQVSLSWILRNNYMITDRFCKILIERVRDALKFSQGLELSADIRQKMILFEFSLRKSDLCWSLRLRCVLRLLLICLQQSRDINGKPIPPKPAVLDCVLAPCLRLLYLLLRNPPSQYQATSANSLLAAKPLFVLDADAFMVDVSQWLHSKDEMQVSFNRWCQNFQPDIESRRQYEIAKHFFSKWKKFVAHRKIAKDPVNTKILVRDRQLELSVNGWLRWLLFNPHSFAIRWLASKLIECLLQNVHSRPAQLMLLLTDYLPLVCKMNTPCGEYFELYIRMLRTDHWRYWFALRGLPFTLASLIEKQINELSAKEENVETGDLFAGSILRMLVELLSVFVHEPGIRQQFKGRLVGCVLNGYLCLRKLVVQRSKQIEDTQDLLLQLLEQMATGSESESASFMQVCVRCVRHCALDDLRTPVFIFERICSLIQPEDAVSPEFFITFEKDPQQEDFLQGRMLGNPYSSNESGCGPLMRDLKNKICRDCELVALLEDDCGMELLVCNKIISLDLAVRDVFNRVWCSTHGEHEPMRVVYRLRGLMGDATEEFVQSLNSEPQSQMDEEQAYRLAGLLIDCDGLQVIFERLRVVGRLNAHSRPLLQVLIKLIDYCVHLKRMRQSLLQPSLRTLNSLLNLVQLYTSDSAKNNGLRTSDDEDDSIAIEQLMHIVRRLLDQASEAPFEQYAEISKDACESSELNSLIDCIHSQLARPCIQVLLRIIPLLTVDNETKIQKLLNYFDSVLKFNQLDRLLGNTKNAAVHDKLEVTLEHLCVMLSQLPPNSIGARFKDFLLEHHILADALDYLSIGAPEVKCTVLAASPEWKEYTQRPALHFILRILNGLLDSHPSAQIQVNEQAVHLLHGLEQLSSDSHVGSLAEALLETICQHNEQRERVLQVRRETREEKKRLAMAGRQKQLGALGMRANEHGQVTAENCIWKQVEDLGEEQGLACCICREGYKFQPNKVLGIYTFSKRCTLEPFEAKMRKSKGYFSVTHFNVVHVDCHLAAVRHARARDEWESAALQNGNTRCNGLLPIWGPTVCDMAFAGSFLRHNAYLQECTALRELGYSYMIHDLKLLLLRFAQEQSFSNDSGGGGPQSNVHLIPYLMHAALYVINSNSSATKETSRLYAFLEEPISRHVQGAFELENVHYLAVFHTLLLPVTIWSKHRLSWLRRLVVVTQARHSNPTGNIQWLPDVQVQPYSVYKSALVFFALIDNIYATILKNVQWDSNNQTDQWPNQLALYIRNNDQRLIDQTDKLLEFYQNDVLPCSSFEEFCDVCGLLTDIDQPSEFLQETLFNYVNPSV